MECKNVEKNISLYLENDLPQEQFGEITSHLKSCPACSELKERMEKLINMIPELEEEVPFFLKNRLYYIPESIDAKPEKYFYFKWVAAVLGVFVLFLNIFYFTNILPPANRALHAIVAGVERLAVETEAFFEKMRESKDMYAISLDTASDGENEENTQHSSPEKERREEWNIPQEKL